VLLLQFTAVHKLSLSRLSGQKIDLVKTVSAVWCIVLLDS